MTITKAFDAFIFVTAYIEQQMNTELHSQLTPDERNETDALLVGILQRNEILYLIEKLEFRTILEIRKLASMRSENNVSKLKMTFRH